VAEQLGIELEEWTEGVEERSLGDSFGELRSII
jgi:hypothetical protein